MKCAQKWVDDTFVAHCNKSGIAIDYMCFVAHMLLRGAHGAGYTSYADNVVDVLMAGPRKVAISI